MTSFNQLRKEERRSIEQRRAHWQHLQDNIDAERKAAAKRHGHGASFWFSIALLCAGFCAFGYVIRAAWGNV